MSLRRYLFSVLIFATAVEAHTHVTAQAARQALPQGQVHPAVQDLTLRRRRSTSYSDAIPIAKR